MGGMWINLYQTMFSGFVRISYDGLKHNRFLHRATAAPKVNGLDECPLEPWQILSVRSVASPPKSCFAANLLLAFCSSRVAIGNWCRLRSLLGRSSPGSTHIFTPAGAYSCIPTPGFQNPHSKNLRSSLTGDTLLLHPMGDLFKAPLVEYVVDSSHSVPVRRQFLDTSSPRQTPSFSDFSQCGQDCIVQEVECITCVSIGKMRRSGF